MGSFLQGFSQLTHLGQITNIFWKLDFLKASIAQFFGCIGQIFKNGEVLIGVVDVDEQSDSQPYGQD